MGIGGKNMKGFKCIVGICEGCFLKNKVCFQKGPKGFCGIKYTNEIFGKYRKFQELPKEVCGI